MYGDSVHIGVIHKPDDLIREELPVVLRREIRLRRFTGVQLKGLSDTLSQDIESGIGFDDLAHRLLNERLHARDPIPKCTKDQTEWKMSQSVKQTQLIMEYKILLTTQLHKIQQ